MKKALVIHHDADFDGIFSKEVCQYHLAKAGYEVKTIGWDYGRPEPIEDWTQYSIIFIIDISLDGLLQNKALWPKLRWIDHHKTAIDKFNSDIPGYRIDGVAACRLGWQWFIYGQEGNLPTKEDYTERRVAEPYLLRLVGEYDIWDHRDPNALILQSGLRQLEPQEFEELVRLQFEELQDRDLCLENCLTIGRRAKKASDAANASISTKFSHDVRWNGLTFLCLNSAHFNSQTFTAAIKPHHQALMGWRYDGQQKRCTVSLYHAPGQESFDLSVFAKAEGGGGHRGACGFQCSLTKLQDIIEGPK